MSAVERNRALASELVANLGAGNGEAIFATFAETIEITFPGSKAVPWAGTHRGLDEVGKAFGIIGESLAIRSLALQYIVADAQRVFMVTDECLTMLTTGVEFEQRVAWVLEVSEGKITRWEMFEDTEAIANAAAG